MRAAASQSACVSSWECVVCQSSHDLNVWLLVDMDNDQDGFAASLIPPGTPLVLLNDPIKGRHFIAARAIRADEVLLQTPSFLTAVLPTHRKRVCHWCLGDKRTRLSTTCSGCLYSNYCDSRCRKAHWDGTPAAGQEPDVSANIATPAYTQLTTGSASAIASNPNELISRDGTNSNQEQLAQHQPASTHELHVPTQGGPTACHTMLHHHLPPVPHHRMCPVIKQFSSFKQDADMQAILIMCLEALARRHLGLSTYSSSIPPHAARPAAPDSPLVPPELLLLVSHMDEQPAKEKTEWARGARFLITAMQRAGWPDPLPTEELIMSLCGRVLANNFGIFAPPPTSTPTPPLSPPSPTSSPLPLPLPATAIPSPLPEPHQQTPQSTPSTPTHDDMTEHLRNISLQQGGIGLVAATPTASTALISSRPIPPTITEASFISTPATCVRSMREEMTGRQLFITTSFFNHSCRPNAEVQGGGSGREPLLVTALTNIAQGDECTITYIDLDLPRAARQATLSKLFSFTCTCERCKEELVHGSDKVTYTRSQQSEIGAAAAARVRSAAAGQRARDRIRKGGGGNSAKRQPSGKKIQPNN